MKLATLKAQVAAMRSALEALEASLAKEEAKRSMKKGTVPVLPASPEGSDAESTEAPKKAERAPNAWFVFTKRVDELLKANNMAIKVPESKQFASSLKAKKGYEWEDDEILEEKKAWVKPEKAEAPSKETSEVAAEVEKIMEEITSDSESDKPKKRGRPSKKTA